MECVICKNGTTGKGLVTFTLERGNAIIVFKNVPAMVCENCVDFYLTSETTQLLIDKASQTLEKDIEFKITNLELAP
jgi:YgiT-type zinc finger domain-containing protein